MTARGHSGCAAREVLHDRFSAGFADQSHFTRAFRAKFGATPRQWRLRREG
jgi:AraC-like DNA-binding protein